MAQLFTNMLDSEYFGLGNIHNLNKHICPPFIVHIMFVFSLLHIFNHVT